jgi:hypothetical protein
MENTFTLSGRHSYEEMRYAVNEALKGQADFAYARFLGFERECRDYETRYGTWIIHKYNNRILVFHGTKFA